MRPQRLAPLRGLLAGILALAVFASSAVDMAAGGSLGDIPRLAQALPAQISVQPDGNHHGDGRGHGDEGSGDRRDGGR
jgi:hypothetical protein